ncbi:MULTISPECIES: tail protein X [Aeromonas]|uniref:tail protein X n=1 Tax=Aeromonas TaxID=642 RepID=UPI000CDD5C74|nr:MULTISPECIES: tail protein X [Aeromonas]AUZ76239.1 hypothetical protein C2U40_16255 [Aeromonas sp. ASNIH4]POU36269.1 hypothetical protein C3405_17530 [Aeromonas hydrophila]POV85932.1 hypothetical protein C3395_21780 [Aeromonas sp. ASNIH6]
MNTLTSLQGERWDALCVRAYGSLTQPALNGLRAANPDAARRSAGFVLPAGLILNVPPISEQEAITPVELAPWQR